MKKKKIRKRIVYGNNFKAIPLMVMIMMTMNVIILIEKGIQKSLVFVNNNNDDNI